MFDHYKQTLKYSYPILHGILMFKAVLYRKLHRDDTRNEKI